MSNCCGTFVSIDGPNGVGKTALIEAVAKNLTARGCSVYLTKELTDTALGGFIRNNHREYRGETLAFLLAADRNDHVEQIIIPALRTHEFVITDRYVDSSLVFQRLDGVDLPFLWSINAKFLQPHLSISITASPITIASRLSTRQSLDRFEQSFSREEEVRLFKEAALFLEGKGFRILLFSNENIDLVNAAEFLSDRIVRLRQG